MYHTILGYDKWDIEDAVLDELDLSYVLTSHEFKRIMDDVEIKLANNNDFSQIVRDALGQAIRDELGTEK